MAELSGRRCLLHSLAVGVSIMRLTEGCLCVGECISALCECIRTVCVCAEWVRLLEMHNNIFGLPVFHGDKGWLLKLQSNGSERCPKAAEHTGTQICTHTPSADSTDRCLCRYGLPDELSIVCNFLHCAEFLSRRRWSQLSAKKCVLINADKVTLDLKKKNKKTPQIQAYASPQIKLALG